MRGKSPQPELAVHARDVASMRPAHYAREVMLRLARYLAKYLASMRPAHYAREVRRRMLKPNIAPVASMRPAHYAREVVTRNCTNSVLANRFNEARALCAGSRRW